MHKIRFLSQSPLKKKIHFQSELGGNPVFTRIILLEPYVEKEFMTFAIDYGSQGAGFTSFSLSSRLQNCYLKIVYFRREVIVHGARELVLNTILSGKMLCWSPLVQRTQA